MLRIHTLRPLRTSPSWVRFKLTRCPKKCPIFQQHRKDDRHPVSLEPLSVGSEPLICAATSHDVVVGVRRCGDRDIRKKCSHQLCRSSSVSWFFPTRRSEALHFRKLETRRLATVANGECSRRSNSTCNVERLPCAVDQWHGPQLSRFGACLGQS